MDAHESAILRTVLYADVFKFALTLEELTRYLISPTALSQNQICKLLNTSSLLRQSLHRSAPYICLATNPEYIELRQEREQQAAMVWHDAMRYGRWLAYIPFVRMVAITGALAMRNPATIDDDFDYILVTKSGRVWMARGFAVLLVRLVRLFGRELCPNYVLAEDRLLQRDNNLYIAHEIVQMQPVYGYTTYHEMLTQNQWTTAHLANALALPFTEPKQSFLKQGLEWLLSGWLGDKIEAWEYKRKYQRFAPKLAQEKSNATIDEAEAKGHFKDNGYPALDAYYERLRAYGLSDIELPQAGD